MFSANGFDRQIYCRPFECKANFIALFKGILKGLVEQDRHGDESVLHAVDVTFHRNADLAAREEIGHLIFQLDIFGNGKGILYIDVGGNIEILKHFGRIDGRDGIVLAEAYQRIGSAFQQAVVFSVKAAEDDAALAVKEIYIGLAVQVDIQSGCPVQGQRQLALLAFTGDGEGTGIKLDTFGIPDAVGLAALDGHAVACLEVLIHIAAEGDPEAIARCRLILDADGADTHAVVFLAGAFVDRRQDCFRFGKLLCELHLLCIGVDGGQVFRYHCIGQSDGAKVDDAVHGRHHLNVLQRDTGVADTAEIQLGGGTADLGGELAAANQVDDLLGFHTCDRGGQRQGSIVYRQIGQTFDLQCTLDRQGGSCRQQILGLCTKRGHRMADLRADIVCTTQLVAEGNDGDDGGLLGHIPGFRMGVGLALSQSVSVAVLPADGIAVGGQCGGIAVLILGADGDDGRTRRNDGDDPLIHTDRTQRLYLIGLGGFGIGDVAPLVGLTDILTAVIAP